MSPSRQIGPFSQRISWSCPLWNHPKKRVPLPLVICYFLFSPKKRNVCFCLGSAGARLALRSHSVLADTRDGSKQRSIGATMERNSSGGRKVHRPFRTIFMVGCIPPKLLGSSRTRPPNHRVLHPPNSRKSEHTRSGSYPKPTSRSPIIRFEKRRPVERLDASLDTFQVSPKVVTPLDGTWPQEIDRPPKSPTNQSIGFKASISEVDSKLETMEKEKKEDFEKQWKANRLKARSNRSGSLKQAQLSGSSRARSGS